MVIEDDYAIRETLTDVLESEGYGVRAVANGRDALALLERGTAPRLILLDLMMPVMDGVAFRSAQQRDPRLALIPVIVLSADHRLDERAGAMAVEGHLSKPFELDALLAAIDRSFRGARGGRTDVSA